MGRCGRIALGIALALAMAPRAEALCEGGPTSLLEERRVPPHATLHLFRSGPADPQRLTFTAREGDTPIVVTARLLGSSPAWHVFELRLDAPHAGTVELTAVDTTASGEQYIDDLWRLEVVPGWRRADAELRSVTRRRHAWECSWVQGVELAIGGNASAYRLEWIDGAGQARRAWIPVGGWGESDPRTLIGHPSCENYNVPPDAFDQPRLVAIVALFADGTEQVVGARQIEMPSHPRMDDPFNDLFDFDGDPLPAQPGEVATMKPLPPLVPWWGYALGGGAGAGVLAAWRRRRRARRIASLVP